MEMRRRSSVPPSLCAALESPQAATVRRRKFSQESPTSPGTAVVRRLVKAQPNVAVVHRVSLRSGFDTGMPRNLSSPDLRPSSSGATRSAGELVIDPANSRKLGATLSSDVRDFAHLKRPSTTGDVIRVLEPSEVADRSQNALDFFKDAKQINRKARTIEDTETMLAQARRRLENGRSRSKESVYQSPAEIGANRILEALAHTMQTDEIDSTGKCSLVDRKMTLAERMGYGVKTTQSEDKFAALTTDEPAAVSVKKGKNVMIGVAAGNNTLKERLAKRRVTVE